MWVLHKEYAVYMPFPVYVFVRMVEEAIIEGVRRSVGISPDRLPYDHDHAS